MTWAVFASLVLKEGLVIAIELAKLWREKTSPTDVEWDALLAKGQQYARQKMLETLTKNGIDPNSPQGQALLALTPA